MFSKWIGGDVFITLPSQVARQRDQSRRGKEQECALSCTPPVHWVNDPVDTSNGNLSYQVTDLSVASLGGNLAFQRSYASFDSTVSRPLGYGWANNFDTRIIAPLLTAHPVTVALQTANGSLLQFFRVVSTTATGTYAPDLGVTAELTRVVTGNVVTYTLVDKLQTTYVFTTSGALLSKRSSLGYLTTYSYGVSDRLTQVTDVGTGRWLQFTYDPQGRMQTVLDHSGRTITFTYDLAGDLANLIDTRGLTWTYVYTGSHLLWKVIDPDNRTVVRTEYDGEGRAIEQYDGLDNRTVKLDFGLGSTRILTDARNFTSTDTYVGGTWIGSLDANSRPITRNYDLNSRPVYLADQNGNATQMLWSPNGHNLNRVVDAGGYTTTMQYDNLNNLTQTVDARGFTTTFTYSGAFLTRKVDALGNTWIFTPTQDGRNLLAAEAAPGGGVTEYQYDQFGQRTVVTDALKNATRYQYDLAGRLITTTDALGRITVNAYDSADNLIRVTTNYTTTSAQQNYLNAYNLITHYGYDSWGRQIAMTDTLNYVTRNGYDGAGRLISVTVNYTTDSGVDPTAYNLTTQYGYDAASNQIAITDTLNHVTRNYYDNLNRLISTTVNYSEAPGLDPNVYNLTTRYQYDEVGQRTIITDATNVATYFEYDTLGRSTATRDMLGNTMRFGYDPLGNRTVMADANGVVTRYGYDPLSRLIAVTESFTTTAGLDPTRYNVVTRYAYDGTGNRTVITDARGYTTTYTYDALSRVLSESNPLSHTLRYQYDAVGNRTVMTDAKNQITRYTYDALDQVLVISYTADATTARFAYDPLGNRTAMTDTTGTTTYVYDAANRPLTITSPITGVVGYRYDALSNRIKLIYPDGKVITYTYNAANQLSSAIDWSGQTTAYSYDKAGRPITTTLPNGVQSVNAYDTANRLTRLTHRRSGTTLADYQYQLDGLGNRVVATETLSQLGTTILTDTSVFTVANSSDDAYVNRRNAQISLTSASVNMGFTPDLFGIFVGGYRFAAVTLPAGGQILNAELRLRAYEVASSATSLNIYRETSASPVTYSTYADFIGRSLSSPVAWSVGTWTAGQDYAKDITNLLNRDAWTNGNAMAFQIDSSGYRLAQAIDGKNSTPARLIITYTYPVSTVQLVTTTILYTYDPLYRLSNANYSGAYTATFAYAYDKVGNRTVQTRTYPNLQVVTGYEYDSANRLTNMAGITYTWDNNGSLIDNGKFTFTYNNAGRMTRAQGITATQVYTYNGDGLLMNRNGARYVWDQAAGLPQMLSDGSTLYVPGVGQWSSAAGWAYELHDGLGSVRQLSDAGGNIVQSYTYAPFGELIAAQGTRSSALRYTGEQTDDDTGLVYLRARWYDSATGRFTTRDPFPGFAAFPRTLHPYVYALNNPINLTDHSGKIVDTIFDIFMVGLDVYFLLSDGLYYLQHPCADASERDKVLGGDLLALAADALLMVVPFAPGGAGLANKGLLILTRVGYQVAPLIRVGQATAKGVQAGTYLARASGSGRGSPRYTSGGEKFTDHGEDRLERGVDIDDVIKHYSKKFTQADGAEVFVKRVGKNKYDVVIRGDGGIVTTLKDQTQRQLDNFARNYGWW